MVQFPGGFILSFPLRYKTFFSHYILFFQRKSMSESKELDSVGDREIRDIASQIMVGKFFVFFKKHCLIRSWKCCRSLLYLTYWPVCGRCLMWACPRFLISTPPWLPASRRSRARWRTAGRFFRRFSGRPRIQHTTLVAPWVHAPFPPVIGPPQVSTELEHYFSVIAFLVPYIKSTQTLEDVFHFKFV